MKFEWSILHESGKAYFIASFYWPGGFRFEQKPTYAEAEKWLTQEMEACQRDWDVVSSGVRDG